MSTDITRASAAEIADVLARREASAAEVTQAHLDRIAAVDGEVHAFLHVDAEGALAAARDIDRRRAAGARAWRRRAGSSPGGSSSRRWSAGPWWP